MLRSVNAAREHELSVGGDEIAAVGFIGFRAGFVAIDLVLVR